MKNILITGGGGFVGSNLAVHIKKRFPSFHVIALDNLRRRGSEINLWRLKANDIHFIHGDIRNKEDLCFDHMKISLIIECSAEPSVLAGIQDAPDYVINTNLMGLLNCLELARHHKADLIFLSSSRVYPIEKLRCLKFKESKTRFVLSDVQLQKGVSKQGISEEFSLEGWRSIYGTTKLASELMIQEYIQTYDLRAVINRCGVIAGPWQMGRMDQGVFAFWLFHHYFKKNLQYMGYGANGKQVRDVLHIQDLSELICIQMQDIKKFNGQIYNVGGGTHVSLSLLETTKICRALTGHVVPIKKIKKDRAADIPIYISDHTRITQQTGWNPRIKAETILSDIYQWLKSNKHLIQKVLFD